MQRVEVWQAGGPIVTDSPQERGRQKVVGCNARETGTAPALPGTLAKCAYLGSFHELTVATALGEIFVVSPDGARQWQVGQGQGLTLGPAGVSVVAADAFVLAPRLQPAP